MFIGSVVSTNRLLLKTPYDATRDIASIATVAGYENLFSASVLARAENMKELIALRRRRTRGSSITRRQRRGIDAPRGRAAECGDGYR